MNSIFVLTLLRSRTCLCKKCKCNVVWVLAPLQNILIKRIYIPTAPLLAVYIFFRDPSGCLAWYIQKYLLCPLSDKTVPIQFLGFIFISLGSGNVKFNIFLYHGSPKNNGSAQLLRFQEWHKCYICKYVTQRFIYSFFRLRINAL